MPFVSVHFPTNSAGKLVAKGSYFMAFYREHRHSGNEVTGVKKLDCACTVHV